MNPDIYIEPNWPAPKNIRAYVTTRKGGVSKAPYYAFNLAAHVGDDADSVEKNREKLIRDLNLPEAPRWLNQVHSTRALEATQVAGLVDADASYTQKPNIVCVTLTADCLPILLCSTNGTEVAAIHAGWRGLLDGIIDETCAKLQSPPERLLAYLGPAIGPRYFEVNEQIRLDFICRNPDNSATFVQSEQGIFADLYALARINLRRCGIASIFGGDTCCYDDADRFFSFRRDNGVTGRMASLIYIEA